MSNCVRSQVPIELGPYDQTQDSGSADAYVDPTFALTGQYASLYHFEGLPDGALAGGVPEPSTWAMLLIGFAGLGYAGIGAPPSIGDFKSQPIGVARWPGRPPHSRLCI